MRLFQLVCLLPVIRGSVTPPPTDLLGTTPVKTVSDSDSEAVAAPAQPRYAIFAISGALGSVIDFLRLGGSALLSSFWNRETANGAVQAVLGEDEISEMLGWRSFPDICIREAADVVKVSKDPDAASNVRQIIVGPQDVARALQVFDDADHDENIAEGLPDESVSARWGRHIHSLSERRHIELPSYELMLARFNAIREGHIEGPSHTEETLGQIAKDADRHGFQPASFDEEVSVDTLVRDCAEICGVYSIAAYPDFKYVQGVMDYCHQMRLMGRLSKEDVFYGVHLFVMEIVQLHVVGKDLAERAFTLSQLLLHMYSEMNGLKSPSIFKRIEEAFVVENLQVRAHHLGNQMDRFIISAGARGDLSQLSREAFAPSIDFVLENGRPGLFAMLFAALDLNMEMMEVRLAADPDMGHDIASRFIGDPYAPGTAITPEAVVVRAREYMARRVGQVSFPTAVCMMDILAHELVPELVPEL